MNIALYLQSHEIDAMLHSIRNQLLEYGNGEFNKIMNNFKGDRAECIHKREFWETRCNTLVDTYNNMRHQATCQGIDIDPLLHSWDWKFKAP